jgi:hypothetical protein
VTPPPGWTMEGAAGAGGGLPPLRRRSGAPPGLPPPIQGKVVTRTKVVAGGHPNFLHKVVKDPPKEMGMHKVLLHRRTSQKVPWSSLSLQELELWLVDLHMLRYVVQALLELPPILTWMMLWNVVQALIPEMPPFLLGRVSTLGPVAKALTELPPCPLKLVLMTQLVMTGYDIPKLDMTTLTRCPLVSWSPGKMA